MWKKFNVERLGIVIGIITVVLTLVYFPVKTEFAAVYKEIYFLKKDHAKHCASQEKQLKEFARLGETNLKLDQICTDLTRLFGELDKCRAQDEKLRETIQKLILKLSSK